jgi:hypothetical protein
MTQKIDEDSVTKEIKVIWDFCHEHVDWPEARRSAECVVSAYEAVKDGIENNSMSYKEKLYAFGMILLGAALGKALAESYVVVVRGDKEPITGGELN